MSLSPPCAISWSPLQLQRRVGLLHRCIMIHTGQTFTTTVSREMMKVRSSYPTERLSVCTFLKGYSKDIRDNTQQSFSTASELCLLSSPLLQPAQYSTWVQRESMVRESSSTHRLSEEILNWIIGPLKFL